MIRKKYPHVTQEVLFNIFFRMGDTRARIEDDEHDDDLDNQSPVHEPDVLEHIVAHTNEDIDAPFSPFDASAQMVPSAQESDVAARSEAYYRHTSAMEPLSIVIEGMDQERTVSMAPPVHESDDDMSLRDLETAIPVDASAHMEPSVPEDRHTSVITEDMQHAVEEGREDELHLEEELDDVPDLVDDPHLLEHIIEHTNTHT